MSLGLLLIAFVVSTALGLLLGVGATRAVSPSALPAGRTAPIWKLALGEAKTPVGGAVAAGRIYVATAEGELIALADPNP